MKKLLICLAAVGTLNGCLVEEHRVYKPAVNPVSPGEVSAMAQGGYSNDEIIGLIHANGVTRKPNSDDMVQMKNAGVSDPVMTAMVEAPIRAPSPAVEYRYRDVYYYDVASDPVFIFGVGALTGYLWGRHIYRH